MDVSEAAAGPSTVSTYPDPPMEYIKMYSDENIAEGNVLPPPAPIQGMYCMFNQHFNTRDPILQNLPDQGIKQLYLSGPSVDSRSELKKINHSILAAFLDLLEIIVRCPDSQDRKQKLNDLELLFFNMHHLINEYRPHQARETLKLMMDVQNRDRAGITDRFQKFYEVVANRLRNCLSEIPCARSLEPDMEQRFCAVMEGESLLDLLAHQNVNEEESTDNDELSEQLMNSDHGNNTNLDQKWKIKFSEHLGVKMQSFHCHGHEAKQVVLCKMVEDLILKNS